MWVYILLGIVLAVMFGGLFMDRSGELKGRGPFDLKKQPKVAETTGSQLMLSESNTGSVRFFLYPFSFQRTGKAVFCTGNENPGEPQCSTGRYTTCVCNGNDCSKCKHDGYANILNISNVVRMELLTAPDASRQNAAAVQLVVRTFTGPSARPNGPTTGKTVVEETLVLPNLPIQKWTMITIAREGRRFDIYYNDSLALSKRTQNMVDIQSAFGPITAGDPMLSGKIATVQVFNTKLSATDVSKEYSRLADTNGQPYLESNQTNLLDYMPLCKGGSCLQGPNVRPASPLLDWDTDYA